MAGEYRFSFGPWNVHEGADPFGPTVRHSISFAKKLKMYKQLGFDGVQFHDDDAVPEVLSLPHAVMPTASDAAAAETTSALPMLVNFTGPTFGVGRWSAFKGRLPTPAQRMRP